MNDLMYLLIVVVFFVLMAGFAELCRLLMED